MVCEILCYVGPNHPTDQDFKTVSLATRMTETVNFDSTDSGKMAWYQFRWINSRGEKGPFSPIYNALVR